MSKAPVWGSPELDGDPSPRPSAEDAGHQELLLAVDELAAAMKAKLNARRAKSEGRLEDVDANFLVKRIDDEVGELADADVAAEDGDEIAVQDVRDEAADVANFAMFVWVRRRRLHAAKPSR